MLIVLCRQPKDVKHTISSIVIQKTVGEDWTKAVAGVHPLDEQCSAGIDITKTNLETGTGTTKKKVTVTNDEDALTEDFFMERTNRS